MLVGADANALEWRMAVALSHDSIGIKELLAKEDVHTNNQVMLDLAPGNEGRMTSKRFLFRTIFRGSGWAFANDKDFKHVSSDAEFWDEKNRQFYRKYAGLNQWHNELAQLCAARRPIVGPTGREWLLTPDEKGKLPWSTFTNYPVQGTAADLMMLARISFARRSKARDLQSILVSTVHDSIVADCPDNEVQQVHELFHEVFNDLQENFKKLFKVELLIPFPCETKYGPDMKNMTKFIA